MTSYEFEKAAKNAVISSLNEMDKFNNVDIKINDLDMVWFAHTLGYKKCTIYSKLMNDYYAEVTYNRGSSKMYVDIYKKVKNKAIDQSDFNFEA